MSTENQSSLRFSLEETIWFQKGQEVDNLLSIVLDPDITIQENEHYVTILGSLQLSGEYKRIDDYMVTEEEFYPSPKFVQNVEEREDGIYNFNHRFPIDITIPITRIESITDVYVKIESFDYEIPERSCLKLTADLSIFGLREEVRQESSENRNNEQEEKVVAVTNENVLKNIQTEKETEHILAPEVERLQEIQEEQAETSAIRQEAVGEASGEIREEGGGTSGKRQEKQTSTVENQNGTSDKRLNKDKEQLSSSEKYAPFVAEARKKPSVFSSTTSVTSQSREDELLLTDITDHFKENITKMSDYMVENSLNGSDSSSKEEKVSTQVTRKTMEECEEKVDISFSAQQVQRENQTIPFGEADFESTSDIVGEEIFESPHESVESESSSHPEKKSEKKKKKGKKKTFTLSEFFARKELENNQELTKMKVCIVQEGETISHFAEKYDVNEHKILRMNNLDITHDIYAGQVLYIPVND